MEFPRLFVEELSQDKAIQVLHRICDQAFATPSLIYSVLYHADREFLLRNTQTIYGETYLAYHHAAVPSWANHLYMTLSLPTRDVALYLQLRQLFLINGEGWLINRDMSVRGERGMSQQERDCVDGAVFWYRSASEREITISRRDQSWQSTAHGQPIPVRDLQRYGPPVIDGSSLIPGTKSMQSYDGSQRLPAVPVDPQLLGTAYA